MKLPQAIKTYCPYCKVHTEHDLKLDRKGKEGTMKRGRRRYEAVKKGYGGSPRTPKKEVYKIGKRPILVLTCKVCKKKQQRAYKARTKKRVEIA
jgi:large subunit ribosomal protein L44e